MWLATLAATATCHVLGANAAGQSDLDNKQAAAARVLAPDEWRDIDTSVTRALKWLADQQQADGSFPTVDLGQPGVTSLCLLAFLADGHHPQAGPFGDCISRGMDLILGSQKPEGLISRYAPADRRSPHGKARRAAKAAVYNHAISGLVLGEVYGMAPPAKHAAIRQALEAAMRWTLQDQKGTDARPTDRGAWRYLYRKPDDDADLSVTGWQLMFLRSAQNAGFAVPSDTVDAAIGYVKRNFDSRRGTFRYKIDWRKPRINRGMAGVGILALALAGEHHSAEARAAADWLLANPYPGFNRYTFEDETYFYGVFHCSQAMYQLGGEYWAEYYPQLANTLLANQNADGSWDRERQPSETRFGKCYTTALCVLALSAPNQLLPVYQR